MSISFVNFLFINSCLLFLLINRTYQLSVNPNVDFVEDDKNEPVPPKIQGVRVIVDANKLNNDKAETIYVKTSGGKQSVGIHTDITFELSENKTDGKSTEDDDNREVPIFLGTDTENGRTKFERRYDSNSNNNNNRPHFYGTNDNNGFVGGNAETWVRFFPSSHDWTTEKYSMSTRRYQNRVGGNSGYIPYGINQKEFMPCVCSNGQSSWRRIDLSPSIAQKQSAVDDKLERPFE